MNEPKEITAKFIECKCENSHTVLHIVSTKYAKNYIQIRCNGCGCSSPLKLKLMQAIKEWNRHFGKSARKIEATWVMDGIWEGFL